jgi:hypothetical protein
MMRLDDYYTGNQNTTRIQELVPLMMSSESWQSRSERVPQRLAASGTPATVNLGLDRLNVADSSSTEPSLVQVKWSMPSTARQRWEQIKSERWPEQNRKSRVANALAALDTAVIDYGLDSATLSLLVEDPDLEDM